MAYSETLRAFAMVVKDGEKTGRCVATDGEKKKNQRKSVAQKKKRRNPKPQQGEKKSHKKKRADGRMSDERIPKQELFLWTQYRAHAAAARRGLTEATAPVRYADTGALIAMTALCHALLRAQLGLVPTPAPPPPTVAPCGLPAAPAAPARRTATPDLLPRASDGMASCCWCGTGIPALRRACPLPRVLPRVLWELPRTHVVAARPAVTAPETRPPLTTYPCCTWYLCSRRCAREVEALLRARYPLLYRDTALRHAFDRLPAVAAGTRRARRGSRTTLCDCEERFTRDQLVERSTGVCRRAYAIRRAAGRSVALRRLERVERRQLRLAAPLFEARLRDMKNKQHQEVDKPKNNTSSNTTNSTVDPATAAPLIKRRRGRPPSHNKPSV